MIEPTELQSKSAKELNELAEKLPKDVAEYMRNLIGSLFNSKKKEKVVKKKDDQESRKGKRSKGKEKGKDNGKKQGCEYCKLYQRDRAETGAGSGGAGPGRNLSE